MSYKIIDEEGCPLVQQNTASRPWIANLSLLRDCYDFVFAITAQMAFHFADPVAFSQKKVC